MQLEVSIVFFFNCEIFTTYTAFYIYEDSWSRFLGYDFVQILFALNTHNYRFQNIKLNSDSHSYHTEQDYFAKIDQEVNRKINFISQMHNNNTSPITTQSKEAVAWHPNRAYIQLTSSIVVDSCFPGGNIATATVASLNPLTIQIEGNTDISLDTTSKYWLYFRIRGFRRDRPLKFILKNANHLRKYIGQSRIKPYMVFKEQGQELWQSSLTPIELCFAQNSQLQGSFTFQSEKYFKEKRGNLSTNQLQVKEEKLTTTTTAQDNKRISCYFAMYYPYTYQDLSNFLIGLKIQYETNDYTQLMDKKAYFNVETITYSFQRRKVQLITITSSTNIQSYSEREPCLSDQIFPYPKDRPFKLKNCPVILLTARVHPSQTSSSYFIEGFVRFLLSDCKASFILRQIFIFHVIPMLNPDGVQHGNFRFDHQLRNLNRYYGQANIQKTPSIRAAEILINYYRNQNQQQSKFTQFYEQNFCRLFLYADVHGHTSALPSFIYGNHTDKVQHMIENKVFCKMLQYNFLPNGFSKTESQFSKKNMTIQERHDEYSKLCSGRVFAGRSDSNQHHVFHSYTLQVLPYWQEFSRRKNDSKGEKMNAMDYSRLLGKAFAITLLDVLDINPQSRFNDSQISKIRRHIQKQCMNEQSRKLLTFKKIESNTEHSSNSQMTKNKTQTYHREYIQRWFSNEIYVKHLLSKQELLKQAKILKFFHKINSFTKIGSPQLFQSPRKSRAERSRTQTEPKQTLRQIQTIMPRQKMIFVCRKQRGKIESRINKQTLQLQNDFLDLISRNKQHEKEMDFMSYKRESVAKKEATNSTDRYENQVISKITQEHKKIAFQIKVKEIMPKKKNARIQTETIASQININQSPSILARNFSKKERERSTPKRELNYNYDRPSFIEEFMMKIRQERQSANVFLNKFDCQQDIRQKAHKLRPSIREQLQEQEKKMLPILRRNKIFTIVSENEKTISPQNIGRIYDSIVPGRRKHLETDSHIDQALIQTKKVLIAQKKDQIIREQILKKSQKMSQYKN